MECAVARGTTRRAVAGAGLAALLLGAAGAAHAETAWVKDELRLNLRTGPGVQFRIVGSVETGNSVDVLERGESWTRVQVHGGAEGWIPAGYLQTERPAAMRLSALEQETAELRQQVEELSAQAERLRQENAELGGRDGEQRSRIEQLTRENLELKAGARWPDRIAGAAIVCAGMLIGALLQRRSGRRSPRIKL
jgi:SH3 domain protein